jgi:hypothetical protein
MSIFLGKIVLYETDLKYISQNNGNIYHNIYNKIEMTKKKKEFT